MTEPDYKELLRNQLKNRAMLYYYFFDEARKVVGEEQATAIMKSAIYRRGVDAGNKLSCNAPSDIQGLKEDFLASVPGGDVYFSPEVERCDSEALDITMHECPLLEAWKEADLPEEDVVKIAAIAGHIDAGTFEGAGFGFHSETWEPGREGCCHLHIRTKD